MQLDEQGSGGPRSGIWSADSISSSVASMQKDGLALGRESLVESRVAGRLHADTSPNSESRMLSYR
jgi:hypothetical protein